MSDDRLEARVREIVEEVIAGKAAAEPVDDEPPPDVEVSGLVLRPGRILSDGSRRGRRWVARRTMYLTPESAAALDEYARVHRMSLGDVLDMVIEQAGIDGKAAT